MLECLKKRTESVIPFVGRGELLKTSNSKLKCLRFPLQSPADQLYGGVYIGIKVKTFNNSIIS